LSPHQKPDSRYASNRAAASALCPARTAIATRNIVQARQSAGSAANNALACFALDATSLCKPRCGEGDDDDSPSRTEEALPASRATLAGDQNYYCKKKGAPAPIGTILQWFDW